ncbi:histidinol-phosphate aminotransferase family protein [Thermococcus argininiproducens]|uniref:Histidinol-phosphate aminotransferase family protein n=1 Tax=Thermococcus argininiproducens TaxID=2866384 RepID=A0A9E7MA33_9EURY|nr:histidinol-phosphate transaminase [Thermococcus argininiproducens]USG99938.1 histidinol-phosphate aminotransferase family protein [Thermococcus argininiproducens]
MKWRDKIRRELFDIELPRGYADKLLHKDDILDCSLGTNPFGTPEIVKRKLKTIEINISKYPDVKYTELRNALSEYWGIEKGSIFFGYGSMGCFEKVNKFVIKNGSKVLGVSPQYTRYVSDVVAMGGIYTPVFLKKENNFRIDLDELIHSITEDHVLLYLDNPHNPTGQVLKLKEVEEIVEEASRKGVLVLIDEAYGDFVEKKESAINLSSDNLIVLRSFSKGFGLASMRVGYAVIKNKELGKLYEKVDLPFPISAIGEVLAVEALKDQNFLENSRRQIATIKQKIIHTLRKVFQIAETHPQTPIMLVSGKGDIYHYFLERKVLTVPGSAFKPLDNSYVRLRVPKNEEDLLSRLF